jgi:hypothetical protein
MHNAEAREKMRQIAAVYERLAQRIKQEAGRTVSVLRNDRPPDCGAAIDAGLMLVGGSTPGLAGVAAPAVTLTNGRRSQAAGLSSCYSSTSSQ